MISCKTLIIQFPYLIQYLLIFVSVLFACLLNFGCNEKHIDSDSVELQQALRDSGVNISEEIDYGKLVEKLRKVSVDVPGNYENSTMTYLDSNANDLIQLPTSKPGILSWHFEKIFFIERDLVFASFSDGEMYGGDLLIEVIESGGQIQSMRTIWNYHK